MELSVPLNKLGKESVNLVGSKSAHLGEMTKIGIPVPPGFAVTTTAYDYFLKDTGVQREMDDALKTFPQGPQTLAEYDAASHTLIDLIMKHKMPREIREAIATAYDELCAICLSTDIQVAVRSSGVAEDLPTASFAGQYDTYLGICGVDELLQKVQACWASLFTPRAIAYRMQNNLGIFAGSISVVVQRMVNARAAGVCFTMHPTNGDRSKIVVDGSWGVGESVVQGMVTPDRFVVDKDTGLLADKVIGHKTRQIAIQIQGAEETEVAPDMQDKPCISDQEAARIAELAKKVELHYGVPQDTEWAVDSGLNFPENVFLLQARPITVVFEKKSSTEHIADLMIRFVFGS